MTFYYFLLAKKLLYLAASLFSNILLYKNSGLAINLFSSYDRDRWTNKWTNKQTCGEKYMDSNNSIPKHSRFSTKCAPVHSHISSPSVSRINCLLKHVRCEQFKTGKYVVDRQSDGLITVNRIWIMISSKMQKSDWWE